VFIEIGTCILQFVTYDLCPVTHFTSIFQRLLRIRAFSY